MLDATHRHGAFGTGADAVPRTPGVWIAPVALEQAMAAKTAPASEAIPVYASHGRWVADCPDCNSAQLAHPADHRFMCCECANVAVGGLWRPLVWPKDARRIGEHLDGRSDLHKRNTTPGQTLAEIAAENDLLTAVANGTDFHGRAGVHSHHPGRASLFEDHTHRWPKRLTPDQVYTCPDCGEENTGLAITAGRAAGGDA